MKNNNKTREQLLKELEKSNKRIVELEKSETGCKQAEEALRDSRYMLQTVLNSIPAALFWKDRDSIYLGGNHTFLEAVGLKSSEEVVGKSDYDFPWEKKQADSFREDDRRVMESGIPEYKIIEPYLQADDTHAWASTNKVPLRDMEGNVVGVLGTYEDITEHKQAEEVLKENEKNLSIAQEVAEMGSWVLDLVTGEVKWSNKLYDIFKLDSSNGPPSWPEEHQKLYHPDDWKWSKELIERSLAEGKGYELTNRTILPDGEIRYIYVKGEIFKDTAGKPVKAIGIVQDITERKQVEEELQMERDKLITIFESMEDGIYIVNKDYDIQYVNPVLEKEFGSPVGKKCHEYFHDSDTPCTFCQNKKVFAGKTVRWEWTSLKNGKTYDLIDTPIKNSDGSISKLEIFRDITKRKQAEEELKKNMKQLERFNRLTVGRELKMIELKQEINELREKAGLEKKYSIQNMKK